MKRPLFYLLFILFTSCSDTKTGSKESSPVESKQTAIDSTEAYVKRLLDDPASYQPAGFNNYYSYSLSDSLKLVLTVKESASLDYIHKDSVKSHLDNIAKIKSKINSLDSTGNKVQFHRLKHSFRSKNVFGATVLNHYSFILDNNFNVIEAKSIQHSE